MHEHRRLILLVLIMTAVAAIIGASGIYIIYQGGIERERARLQDVVQVQARLLEALAGFDATYSSYPGGAAAGSTRSHRHRSTCCSPSRPWCWPSSPASS